MGDAGDFIRHIKTIINSLIISDSPIPTSEFSKVMSHNNRFIVIPRAVGRNYHAAFMILKKKASAANRQISDEQLDALLAGLLKKLHVGGRIHLNTLSSDVQVLFNTVRRLTFNDYTILVPIRHLRLGIDSIKVGHVEFVRMSDALAQRISSQPDIVRMLGNPSNNEGDILQALQKFFDVDCLAIVDVKANDDQKAVQIAIQRIEQSLNVLRFFRIDSAATIDGHGLDRGSTRVLYWNSTLKTPGVTIDSSRLTFPRITITQSIWDDRKKLGLADINDLLLKPEDDLNQLEEDILSAVYWLGKSLADSSETDEFVKIMLALDLLLGKGLSDKKEKIARRFASIVYAKSPKETILQVYDHIKKLYSIRNSIMHAGEKYVDDDSIAAARVYAIKLIVLLLENASSHATIADLINNKFPMRDDVFSTYIAEKK